MLHSVGLIHIIISVFSSVLVLFFWVRVISSWLLMMIPLGPVIWIHRFSSRVTDPIMQPIIKRLPRMAVSMLDISSVIAFFFSIWAITLLTSFISDALPAAW